MRQRALVGQEVEESDGMQQVTVPASALSARQGRAFLATFCRFHAVPAEVMDDAVLLISEVVGNAYLHARSSAQIRAEYTEQVLHVEVADDSPLMPQLRPQSRDATGGRGLLILDALSARWGAQPAPPGKVVWFDVPR